MSNEVSLELEDVIVASSSDPDYIPSKKEAKEAKKENKVPYKDRFESILSDWYDDKKNWWEGAVESCIKKDDDFRERVSRKAGQAEGGVEGEKPRRQAIIEVMVDLLLEIEEISLSKALVYTLDEGLIEYPRDFMAKELLKRGANPNEETNSRGQTPLHLAVKADHAEELLKVLLRMGALVDQKDEFGDTPLLDAANDDLVSIVKLLMENGAANAAHIVNNEKKTALHLVAQNNNTDMIELFCDLGLSVEAEDLQGWRPLHEAAYYACANSVTALLFKGANINALDSHKKTPLHVAAEDGEEDVVICLLNEKADANMSDLDGYTAIDLAVKGGHEKVSDLLLAHMMDSSATVTKYDHNHSKTINKLLEASRGIKDYAVASKLREMSPFGVFSMMRPKECGGRGDYNFLKKFARDKTLKESTRAVMDHFVLGKWGVNCEFIEADSKGITPDKNGYDPNSSSLLDVIVETNNKELARHPAVMAIVKYKWKEFVGRKFTACFGVYLLRTLLFALALLIAARPDLDNPGCYRGGWDIVRGILEGLTFILFVVKGLDEVSELIQYKKEYIKDYYNWLQVLAISMPSTIIPFRAATTWCASTGVGYCALPNVNSTGINSTDINVSCIVASHVQWIFAAVAYLANAILILEYLAIFKLTGVYVRILYKIVKTDISRFSILYLVFLFFFVGSFYFALRAGVTITSDGQIISDASRFQLETLYPWNVLFTGVRILVESQGIIEGYFANDDDSDVYVGYQWFSVALYMLFLFVVIVVLLNLLIAQMSDSYTKVQEDVEGLFAIARLRIVVRLQKRSLLRKVFHSISMHMGCCPSMQNYKQKFYKRNIWIELPEGTKPRVEEDIASKFCSLSDRVDRISSQTEELTRLTKELAEELLKEKRTREKEMEEEAKEPTARDGNDFSLDWSSGDFDDDDMIDGFAYIDADSEDGDGKDDDDDDDPLVDDYGLKPGLFTRAAITRLTTAVWGACLD